MTKVFQEQIKSRAYTTTGTASAYVLTIADLDALYDEMVIVVEFHVENDAGATLNINSLGAIAIKTSEGNAVDTGDLKTTGRYTLVYDSNDNSFIVNQMVDSEIHNIVGGNGTIIPGFNDPYDDFTTTDVVGEDILTGQHCVSCLYRIYLSENLDVLFSTSSPSYTLNYGQAFERKINAYLSTLNFYLYFPFSSYDIGYTLTAKIYAITGTYGVDAVKTGSALYTSNTLSGNESGSAGFRNLEFTFNQSITAGQYIVMIEGTAGGLYGNVTIYGISGSAPYLGNTANDTTPIADTNMYIKFNSTDSVVMLSNASDSYLSKRIGVAIEDKTAGNIITLQTQGEVDQTGATNDGTVWYLSNTPGELSSTAGTNVLIIGQGSDTDKVWMGRTQHKEAIDLIPGDTYYTNTECMVEANYTVTYSGSQSGGNIEVQISDDNITYYKLAKYKGYGGGYENNDNNPALQCVVPAGKFFKVIYSYGTVIGFTNNRCRIRPIK